MFEINGISVHWVSKMPGPTSSEIEIQYPLERLPKTSLSEGCSPNSRPQAHKTEDKTMTSPEKHHLFKPEHYDRHEPF